ncbi:hypothetical protein QQP08_017028 [Theobroma cacao]|nr:hypothetical protein QQP08_017028 [Theobroma cacao]
MMTASFSFVLSYLLVDERFWMQLYYMPTLIIKHNPVVTKPTWYPVAYSPPPSSCAITAMTGWQEQLEDSSTAKHGHHEFETFNGQILKDLAVAPEFKTCGKGLRMCSNLFIARSKEWSPLSTSSCGKEWLVKIIVEKWAIVPSSKSFLGFLVWIRRPLWSLSMQLNFAFGVQLGSENSTILSNKIAAVLAPDKEKLYGIDDSISSPTFLHYHQNDYTQIND